ncbi:MAG: nucleotidyltransferase domain-containing protein [Acidimicrobiia bacterium]
MVTDDRLHEYATVTTQIAAWARTQDDVVGVAVVGSWARDAARMDSDIDIVVLTNDKARYLDDDHWVAMALVGPAEIVRRQDWGP